MKRLATITAGLLVTLGTGTPVWAAGAMCAKIFTGSAHADYSPLSFLNQQMDKVSQRIQLETQAPEMAIRNLDVSIRAKRDDLMGIFYEKNFVEVSEVTHLLADKLIMAKTLQKYLGPRFAEFHPPTAGLKEFLVNNNFVNASGKVTASREALSKAMDREFPDGFIIKPALDWSSSGKSFYKNKEEILDLLLTSESSLYKPADMFEPFQGNRTGRIGSGEKFILMGLIRGTSGLGGSKYGDANEFRAHAFYNHVVKGATETRWYTPQNEGKIQAVDNFVETLLNTLPRGFAQRMGLSFDVFITQDGKLQLIEVNTNRGEQTNWSGFLRTPKTIGAYARHMRDIYGWKIQGTEGWMFYNNLANVKPHVKHELIEWMKDAQTPGKEVEALEGFRQLHEDFFRVPLSLAKDPVKMQSADFQALVKFAQEYHQHLSPVKKVGDKAWNEFAEWAKRQESL